MCYNKDMTTTTTTTENDTRTCEQCGCRVERNQAGGWFGSNGSYRFTTCDGVHLHVVDGTCRWDTAK